MESGELARFMHERYEEIAKEEGLENQDKTKVDFDELPEARKETLFRLAEEIMDKIAESKIKSRREG